MQQGKRIILYILGFNCLFLIISLLSNANPLRLNTNAHTNQKSQAEISPKEEVFTKAKVRKIKTNVKKIKKEIKRLQPLLDESSQKLATQTDRRKKVNSILRLSNPFFLLGAYPKITDECLEMVPDENPDYEQTNYGLVKDDDYCEVVDFYNLAHPENMFDSMNFLTDYSRTGLVRSEVIRKIGIDTMRQVSRYMEKEYHLNPVITNYFTKAVNLHKHHQMGKQFNCATQMYNHIPGHEVLKRKDFISDNVDLYAVRFKGGREHCFNKKTTFFPYTYRLYVEEECQAFFTHINSEEYISSLQKMPLQFLIKSSPPSLARGYAVFPSDNEEYRSLMVRYDDGNRCGIEKMRFTAETYIVNPLLLDLDNKFDLRVYMLIASTNPLIVYYHDGFSAVSYPNNKLDDITSSELREYMESWAVLESLRKYLYESGKVKDPNWIENIVKPKVYQALIHTARMSAHAFWNQSNVYELFSVDFALDNELNLWFQECLSSPAFIGYSDYKTRLYTQMLEDLFEIQYGLYRSRMRRVLNVIKKTSQDRVKNGKINYVVWRSEYAEAVKNRFEPEYEISPDNSFKLIMDMNREGKEAFFGHLDDECTY